MQCILPCSLWCAYPVYQPSLGCYHSVNNPFGWNRVQQEQNFILLERYILKGYDERFGVGLYKKLFAWLNNKEYYLTIDTQNEKPSVWIHFENEEDFVEFGITWM